MWFAGESEVAHNRMIFTFREGIIVFLGEVIPEGSLGDLLGCEGLANNLGLQEPGLTAGHHLTCLHWCKKKLFETLEFKLGIICLRN